MTGIVRWEGTVTAQSSIVHGAETLGTVTYLRRERFLMPNGSIEQIPTVSGNALRGLLRDKAADIWWKSAGEPKLTLAVMHALWSGGALAKIAGDPLTGSRLAEVKNVCPVVGVFGTAGGGRIVGGALQVGKLIPICVETAHLIPEHLRTNDLPTIWDLTQLEYYSRIPNEFDEDPEKEEPSRLARFGVETFVAGTRFHSWISLTWPTPIEEAFFEETLAAFSHNPRVGGMARAGHGELTMDLKKTAGPLSPSPDWRALSATDPARLREVLSWLD